MKMSFILGPMSVGVRPLDFNAIFNSPRGLTGTEISLVMNALEFKKLGHDVTIFTVCTPGQPEIWNDIKLKAYAPLLNSEIFDAVISINEPYCLYDANENAVRVFCQYLNDFTYCPLNWHIPVDIFTAPCQMLIDHLEKQAGAENTVNKWNVLPLGCSPEIYSDNRVSGRVVWTSSADRGLHWLLQCWPQIKLSVPNANLKIFYNFNYGDISSFEQVGTNHPHVLEMAQRIRYMEESIKRLNVLDVEHVGSVSREIIQKEYSEAMVLAYPFSPVAFTEGFSLSIMEACAAGVLPVISDGDCLGSIYGEIVPMVKSPVQNNLNEFALLVIKGLINSEWHSETTTKTKAFAQNYTWPKVAKQLEELIIKSDKYRKNNGQ